ncbi:hypothetical protein JX266_014106 [Neoarthrinium moseri]|nr:hypothetical protein JX266_014106 [Neoarthrinium moseri]
MAGFLIPEWYQEAIPTLDDLLIVSIIWGFTLASGLFAAAKAFKQTRRVMKRARGLHAYSMMVWAEWSVSMVIGVLSWLFIRGIIPASFWVYFALLCLWVIQIQCICGIIINRIALLMMDKRQACNIRWVVAVILGLVNISVFIIWIPARLQISPQYIAINEIWDRIEKVIFLLVDAGLNIYFIHLVRSRLIANGLTKYMPLFRYNMFMVAVSMSLDIILIGTMSIPNGLVYVQFHPLVYILKLHIEMNIADLIVKVVKATGDRQSPYAFSNSQGTELRPRGARGTFGGPSGNKTNKNTEDHQYPTTQSYAKGGGDTATKRAPGKGITKIMQTTVVSKKRDDLNDDNSSQSSTRHLQNQHSDSFV